MLMAMAPNASAGVRWSGIDPELLVNGHRVNIIVAVPPGTWCLINGPIEFNVLVPDLDSATLVSESHGEYTPGGSQSASFNTRCGTLTHTTLGEHDASENLIYVSGLATPRGNTRMFPIDLAVYVDGEQRVTCSGKVGLAIDCAPIYLEGGSDTLIETSSEGNGEETTLVVSDNVSEGQNIGSDAKASGNPSPRNQDNGNAQSQPSFTIGSAGHNEKKDSNSQSNASTGANPKVNSGANPGPDANSGSSIANQGNQPNAKPKENSIMELSKGLENVTSFTTAIIKMIAKTVGIMPPDTDPSDDEKKDKAKSSENKAKGKAR